MCPTATTNAVAVSTPTPGIVCSRVATGCASANCASWRSTPRSSPQARGPRRRPAPTAVAAGRAPRRPRLRGSRSRGQHRPRTDGDRMPVFRNSPRIALIRATRAVCHWVRTRCSACSACCSTVFTGTGRISPHRFASRMASASVRSVLFRRTYGRTYWTGNKRTCKPAACPRRPSSGRYRRIPSPPPCPAATIKESLELPTRQPTVTDDPSRAIRQRHLKYVLCEIHATVVASMACLLVVG